jgi:hypothetical protein
MFRLFARTWPLLPSIDAHISLAARQRQQRKLMPTTLWWTLKFFERQNLLVQTEAGPQRWCHPDAAVNSPVPVCTDAVPVGRGSVDRASGAANALGAVVHNAPHARTADAITVRIFLRPVTWIPSLM